MAMLELNVARRPFVSAGPLIGLTIAFALLVAFSTCRSVYGICDAVARERFMHRQVLENRAYAVAADREAERLNGQISSRDARELTKVAASIQEIVQKRRLSWSVLLDALASVLPADVKVLSILPTVKDNRLGLVMRAVAKSDKAMLRFFGRLSEGPFSNARIMNEELRDGRITFNIGCDYNPAHDSDSGAMSEVPDGDGRRRTAALATPGLQPTTAELRVPMGSER